MKPNRHSLKPVLIWADYDQHQQRGEKWAFYTTKAEQRSVRPDLAPVRGVFVPLPAEPAARPVQVNLDGYLLTTGAAGKVIITAPSGEAGEFSAAKLAAFFAKEF